MTPLIAAAQYNQDAIPILLRAGADVNAHETQRGETALSLVAYYGGTPELVTALLKAGANIEAQDNSGDTALMGAVMYNPNPEVVRTLLKANADINAQDKGGMTPLMWTARGSNSSVVLILLNAGANAKTKDSVGNTALTYAKFNSKLADTDALQQLQKASQ